MDHVLVVKPARWESMMPVVAVQLWIVSAGAGVLIALWDNTPPCLEAALTIPPAQFVRHAQKILFLVVAALTRL
jgi:hypothetical protein